VSARHAQLTVREGVVFLRDVGSRHGTTVRGERIGDTAVRVEVGDTVTLADATLRYLGLFTDTPSREVH
jgi:pSer/pThr/pTyr-binding forkhead associated (FHA) protein